MAAKIRAMPLPMAMKAAGETMNTKARRLAMRMRRRSGSSSGAARRSSMAGSATSPAHQNTRAAMCRAFR
ncbi:hypothetical protein GCM10009099_38400 [Caenispirillum bisanense]